jgi:Flp pilus assembly protein TadD
LAASILLAGLAGGLYIGASAVYAHFVTRTLNLCVVTDADYRQERPDWQTWLRPVLAEVNRVFLKAGVQWRVSHGADAYPPEAEGDIQQRAVLVEQSDCKADVILALTARPDRHADSVAHPFSHTLLLEVTPQETPAMAAVAIARALARLFGVPVAPRTLILSDAAEGIFDSAATELISDMRWYDFVSGISALPGRWESRAADALARSMAGKKPHPDADAHRILGNAFASGRRYSDAVRQFREAVRLDPDDASLHFSLAMALQQDSDVPDALIELRTASRMEPSDAQPHAAAGAILLNANRVDEAVEELRQAVAVEPRNASYQAALGTALSRQVGGARDAAAAFESAVKLRPLEPGAMAGLISANNVEESLQQAAHMLESTVQKNPTSAQTHLDLGVAKARAGELDAAQKEFRRAIELQPSNGMAHVALARTYYMAERYAEAEAEIKAAQSAGATPPTQLVEDIRRKLGREIAK